jgi:protease II
MDTHHASDLVHVVFEQTNYKHWIFKFLHPEFQHCYVVKSSRGGHYWTVVNQRRSGLEFETEPKDLYPTVRDYAGKNAKIVTIKVEHSEKGKIHHLSMLSCVDICKAALGIKAFFIWTPYQLYKRLRHE